MQNSNPIDPLLSMDTLNTPKPPRADQISYPQLFLTINPPLTPQDILNLFNRDLFTLASEPFHSEIFFLLRQFCSMAFEEIEYEMTRFQFHSLVDNEDLDEDIEKELMRQKINSISIIYKAFQGALMKIRDKGYKKVNRRDQRVFDGGKEYVNLIKEAIVSDTEFRIIFQDLYGYAKRVAREGDPSLNDFVRSVDIFWQQVAEEENGGKEKEEEKVESYSNTSKTESKQDKKEDKPKKVEPKVEQKVEQKVPTPVQNIEPPQQIEQSPAPQPPKNKKKKKNKKDNQANKSNEDATGYMNDEDNDRYFKHIERLITIIGDNNPFEFKFNAKRLVNVTQ